MVVVRASEQTVPAGKVEEAALASPPFEKNTEKRGSRFNDIFAVAVRLFAAYPKTLVADALGFRRLRRL